MDFSFIGVHYWAWAATFYLVWLTWQDLTNKRMVDDRKNWFMMGVSVSLVSHIARSLWYILLVIVVVVGLMWFLKRWKSLGVADIHSLGWMFLGLALISVWKLAFFAVLFVLLTLFYAFMKNKVFKYSEPTPFYPVLLVVFVLGAWFMGLY